MTQAAKALLQELENSAVTHQRRREIGVRLAQIGDPRPGVGVKKGTPQISWLPVSPGGEVEIVRVWHATNEKQRVIDRQTAEVGPFYIAKYLVTHRQFQAFADAEDGFYNLDWWEGMAAEFQRQPLPVQRTKLDNAPRDGISWYQSVAFARWMHQRLSGLELADPSGTGTLRVGENAQVRLPTEWEWQWAAQNGAEKRPFPWGEANTNCANSEESGLNQSTAVGMYPSGAAACGALDMAGNLMEWCINDKKELATIAVESCASKVLRGGDWGYSFENVRCTYCDDDEPGRIDILNGCRLVLAPDTNLRPFEQKNVQ